MGNNLTIDQIKKEKKQAAEAVKAILIDLKEKTGLEIYGIDVNLSPGYNDRYVRIDNITIKTQNPF